MRHAAVPRLWLCALVVSVLSLGGCVESGGPPGVSASSQAPAAQPGAYLEAGRRLLAADEPELAYKAFMNAIRVDGLSAEALIGAGLASEKQGMLVTARRYFENALEIDPNSAAANNNLGVVLFRLKEYHAARNAFRAAFALSSGRSEIAERNLNRTEAVLAQIEEPEETVPAVSHRVVRLGTSEFRITPLTTPSAEMMQAE